MASRSDSEQTGLPRRGTPGRPRLAGPSGDLEPKEPILQAAAHLFAQNGFSHTTTAAIAKEAGLQQSSLYYYFPTKSAILAEIVRPFLRPQLQLLADLREAPLATSAKLWLFIRIDVESLASTSVDINEALSIRGDAALRPIQRDRERLVRELNALVTNAIHDGELMAADARQTTMALLAFDTGMQRAVGTAAPKREKDLAVREAARFVADTFVRGRLVRPSRLRSIATQADRYLLARESANAEARAASAN